MLHFINPREKKKNKSKVAEVATDCIKSKFSLKTTREFPKNMSFSLFLSEIAGLLFTGVPHDCHTFTEVRRLP